MTDHGDKLIVAAAANISWGPRGLWASHDGGFRAEAHSLHRMDSYAS